ncbi:MAG: hypothetical protein M3Y54_09170 [Bacteroidota bacterium]|nr:hypothetical protein [Bacteroidota bacterium]
MSTENIDDLFRRQLGDHATPPGDDLWARLQAGPDAAAPIPEPTAVVAPERIDQLYQQRLTTHATPPAREIWERLEDEHLRPRKRRAAAWWPMAMAAAVLILLLAGGAGLWRGFSTASGPVGTVASQSANGLPEVAGQRPATGGAAANTTGIASQAHSGAATAPTTQADEVATNSTAGQNVAQAAEKVISDFPQKNLPARATRSTGPASNASKVGMMAQQSPRRPQGASRQPDAAASSAPLVARTTAPPTTPTQPADELTPAVAATNPPAAASTLPGENVPAAATAATLAAANIITVDVRSSAPRRPSLATAVASAAAATAERRGLGGRLLRQVGHAVRGERISLSEVTGLPENLTLEANIAGRRVSKSIQL